ncbi:hypothetical protein [Clostridium sp.]|uniref:hypothetical protein n=1 Tax=Clostridium sp. TaxID=1506 RepID=UPI0029123CE6|nr:hypothetical protein [Clostridium sp.]MDU3410105.1 hypothetical protein [Clostridium sp.]
MYIQNLKKLDDFKVTLMKTSKIPLCEVDKNFVDDIKVKWDDYSEMNITVSNRIMINGEIVDNSYLYNAFKGKRQQVLISNPAIRFVITNCTRKESSVKDSSGKRIKTYVKEISLKSYETTIGKLILTEDIQRQLWNDGTDESMDISDGILNLFEQDNPDWRVKFVSQNSMKEFGKIEREFEETISNNVSFTSVARGKVIWEKNFNINPYSENIVMNLKVMYGGVKTYANGKLQDDTKYIHSLNNIYTGVRKIKAIYNKSAEGVYSINYQITLGDGIVLDKWSQFSYCDGLKLDIEKILFTYTTGEEYEGTTIKYRNFDKGEYDWVDFLRANVSTAFGNLYFKFDTINKELYCYTKKEYGEHKGIQFSYDNFVQEINKIDALDNIVSKLYVYSNNCSIADVNEFGSSDYILNYNYFYNNDGMTDELKLAWDRYKRVIEGKNDEMYDLRLQINTLNKKLVKLESEKTALDYDIRNLEIRRTSYISDNKNGEFDADIKRMSTEINSKKDKFEQLMINLQVVKDDISKVNGKIKEITLLINLETSEDSEGKIFDNDLLEELRDITVEETVTDDTYLTSNGLYGHYVEVLEEKNTKGIDFTIDSKGFMDNIIVPKGVEWDFYIKMGDFVDLIDDDEVTINEKGLRITEYTLIPKGGEIEVKDIKLTNRDMQLDDFSGATTLKSDVSRANSYVNNYKTLWEESVGINDFYKKINTEGMDLRANAIRSRSNRVKFDFTESGLYVINADEEVGEDMQIYCGAGMICFTEDRWLSCKTALDSKGLVGETIVGKILIGEKLYIVSDDDNSSFYIGNMDKNDGFGLSIKDGNMQRIFLGTEVDSDGVRRAKLRITSANGRDVVLDENGVINRFYYQYSENLDSSNPIELPIDFDSGVGSIKSFNITIKPSAFRSYSRGVSGGGNIISSGGSGSYSGTSSTTNGGSYSNYTTTGTANWSGAGSGVQLPTTYAQTVGNEHYHYYSTDTLGHDHFYNIVIPNHFHNYTVSFGTHTHEINTSHTHTMEHGIYKSTIASNIYIKVNGQTVRQNINSTTTIDIAQYLNPQTSNMIIIGSATLGRIDINVSARIFSMFA